MGSRLDCWAFLQAQAEARRAAERRLKDIEIKLSAVVTAKNRIEREARERAQASWHACVSSPQPCLQQPQALRANLAVALVEPFRPHSS